MKAMLLAAGLGTRLRPLTDNIPKCLVPVAGKPLMQHNLGWLRAQGVDELVVNLFNHAGAVVNFLGDGSAFGVRVNYSREPELMGTAGAIWMARRFFLGERFWVVYGDNLFNVNLARLENQHRSTKATLTMALFWREDVSASGVANLNTENRIVSFQEKPGAGDVSSHWVNAGLYLCEPEIFTYISPGKPWDFGYEVFPAMLEAEAPIYGYLMGPDESLYWIDTREDLARSNTLLTKESQT
jgi:NDP-sugar pyrophosphorylase family protein